MVHAFLFCFLVSSISVSLIYTICTIAVLNAKLPEDALVIRQQQRINELTDRHGITSIAINRHLDEPIYSEMRRTSSLEVQRTDRQTAAAPPPAAAALTSAGGRCNIDLLTARAGGAAA